MRTNFYIFLETDCIYTAKTRSSIIKQLEFLSDIRNFKERVFVFEYRYYSEDSSIVTIEYDSDFNPIKNDKNIKEVV